MKFKTFTITLFCLFSMHTAFAQGCCNGLSGVTFATYCLTGLSPACDGSNCSEAIMNAIFPAAGGSWIFVTCADDPPADCAPAGCTGGLVPVELSSFDLKIEKDGILIQWETLTEIENKGFFLEHSKDAKNWSELTFTSGEGTTVEPQLYKYLHNAPHLGVNYYRLVQVDFNGATEKTDAIVAVWRGSELKEDMELVVVPNPASASIIPVLPPALETLDEVVLEIFDMSGKVLYAGSHYLSTQGIQIDIAHLQAGRYIIRAKGEHMVYNTTFVKVD